MAENSKNYIEELNKNGVIAVVPKGNSMWPTLKNKKQSVIVKKKTEKLNRADVALYKRENGSNVLHRVIEPTDYGYIMCGDSQFVYEKVKEEDVYGVMMGFYRGKRYVDANNAEYIEKVKKWYRRDKLRKFCVKTFYFFENLKSLPKRVLRKLFGKKRTKQGEDND